MQAAADLLTAPGHVALPSQCGADPRFNCDVNNHPVSTMLQLTRNSISIAQGTLPGSTASPANTYVFTTSIALQTESDVPVWYSGVSCNIRVDTSKGRSSRKPAC